MTDPNNPQNLSPEELEHLQRDVLGLLRLFNENKQAGQLLSKAKTGEITEEQFLAQLMSISNPTEK